MSAESCGYTANVEAWAANEIRRLEANNTTLSQRIGNLAYLIGGLQAQIDALRSCLAVLGDSSSLMPAGAEGEETALAGEEQDVDG